MAYRFLCCWLLIAVSSAAAARAAGPFVTDGKDATVLVDLGEEGSGSGFCLDAKGLFVTNRHVIASVPPGAKVKVVYHPSEPDQRVLEAVVVARSAKFDLAVLKVDRPGELKAVKLGDDATVSETDAVTAFGYPFGKMLAGKQSEYPAVSINTGKVTALRREGKVLSRLQIDATVNPGNSGGPVLDAAGKVIGVVVSGVHYNGQTGVNFAIPVSQLREFLKPTYVELAEPTVQYANRHEEAEFVASVFHYGPADADLGVDLVLDTPGIPARTIPLRRRADGTFAASAVAVPDLNDATLLPVSALTDQGLQRGWVKDHEVQVGGQTVKLSELKSMATLPDPRAVFVDGRKADGPLANLGSFTSAAADSGGPVSVDLASAVSIRLDDPSPPDGVVRYRVTARSGTKVLGDGKGTFALANAPGADPDAVKPPEGMGPPGDDDEAAAEPVPGSSTRTIQFPAGIDRLIPAGAGRFEVIHLRDLRTFAIVDLVAGKVTGWVPVDTANPPAAANLTELIVTTPDKRGLLRYDLRTGKPIGAAHPSRAVQFTELDMGDASDGPLIACVGHERMVLQVPSFREVPPTWAGPTMAWEHVRVSGDGHTLAGWSGSFQPEVFRVHLRNDRVTGRAAFRHATVLMPDYDGSNLYAYAYTLDRTLAVVPPPEGPMATLPTHSMGVEAGLAFGYSDDGFGVQLVVMDAIDGRPLCPLPPMPELFQQMARVDPGDDDGAKHKEEIASDLRLSVVPQAGLAVVVPMSDDRLIVHHFDLDRSLAKAASDYLVVLSNPPTQFAPGKPYAYAVDARSTRKPLKYQLQESPAGMAVSDGGQVTWQPPATLASDRLPVSVLVTDAAGKTTHQSFAIERRDEPVTAAPADAAAARAAFERALCQSDDLTLAKTYAATAGADAAAVFALADQPMETLGDADAKTLADWYLGVAGRGRGDLEAAASAHAARYLMLYLAEHGAADADRDAAQAAVAKLTVPDAVDLIASYRRSMFVVEGKVTAEDAGIHIQSPDKHPRLVTGFHPRGSYRLHYEFTPKNCKESAVVFPVGDGSAVFNLGGWDGCIGLCDVDGLPHKRAEVRPWKMRNGHPYAVDLYVVLSDGYAHVAADLDGKRVLDWSGHQDRIHVQLPTWSLPYYGGIALCGGDATYTVATLTPIDAAINPRGYLSARTFAETYLSDLTAPAGGAFAGQALTLTPPTGGSAAYVLSKKFDRFDGSVHLPAAGTGDCAVACDGVVRWRSAAALRGRDQPFSLDVHDVAKLELTTRGEPTAWTAVRLRQSDEPVGDPASPFWASVAAAATRHSGVRSRSVGGNGGNPFEELFPDDGILVGMRVSFLKKDDDWYVRSLQALYQTPDGESHLGLLHGIPGEELEEDTAPAGYAVGRIDAAGSKLVDGLRFVTMRVGPAALDADGCDNFSLWHGKQNNLGDLTPLGVKARPIVGLRGRAGDSIDGLGVITAP